MTSKALWRHSSNLQTLELKDRNAMTGTASGQADERLSLHSRLSDIAHVSVWIESIASRRAIPANTQYAMNLCLEEVLVNIVRHGYGREGDSPIRLFFKTSPPGHYVFIVEDDAPHFNPLDAPERSALGRLNELQVGGQGLRLLRRFADSLEYKPTTTGNQLHIGFTADDS
jgi:serine/threonine-protein kinase RsbW